MTAPLPPFLPIPGNFGLPLVRHQDLVIRMAPKAPATEWPAELESIKLILEPPDAAPLEFLADLMDGTQAVIKVESTTTDAWPKGWPWSIQMNWAGPPPIYNQVPTNGLTVRYDGKRRP
ncbi:hypothetical protein [Nocardia phage KYD2]|nr:hypothetical protein [Nocardia phage KYD2]